MARSKNIPLNISGIFQLAQKENWVVEYDAMLDSFYWTKPIISKTAKLKKFLDDFSLYINHLGHIEGVFIEYAKYNFAAHNEDFKVLFDKFDQLENGKYVISTNRALDIQPILRNMADRIGNETLEAIEKGLDLNQVAVA